MRHPILTLLYDCESGSVVGIASGYGLDGPGIESWWGEIFRICQDRPWGPPTQSFPGVKSGRGVTLTLHPLLVPWSRKGRAIPLLPVWAVRPVQSLNACTRVHIFYLPYMVSRRAQLEHYITFIISIGYCVCGFRCRRLPVYLTRVLQALVVFLCSLRVRETLSYRSNGRSGSKPRNDF